MLLRPFFGVLAAGFFVTATVSAADWTQFRGPGGLASSDETGLPVKWSETENLAWRTPLPGAGTSSPIVLGKKIFLTCYSGYGQDRQNPGEMKDLKRYVVCLDRQTGKILWQKGFKSDGNESRYRGNGARHGYSSSTPTTDGKQLYVFFGKEGVYCFDLEGKQIWHTSVGTRTRGWGSANSPVLYENVLIINASVESGSLVGLDKRTGKELWRTPGIRGSWNTPLLVSPPGGKTELVVSIPRQILGINPLTGEKLWNCDGIPDRGYVCPSVVAHDGIVYAIGGRKNTAIAVRAGGTGDVTATHRLWKTGKGSNVCSPVFHNNRLYWVHERRGTAICLDAKSGNEVFQKRLSPRPGLVYSSVTVADGKIYCVSQHKGTYVFSAGEKFELLAHNEFKDDDSRSNACPVVSNGQLLLRSDRYLFCVGKKTKGR
ncbi:MAG: PQQ-like beta-propeller repeat protein [Planctomycetes bacterium]|nr:PQQ-like beta-propeller repeat protein [Planctomycetota bacterium]